MPPTPDQLPPAEFGQLKFLAWLLLAGFGGAVKYVSAILRSTEPITSKRFLILLCANVFVSSFCGLMGLLLVANVTTNWEFHGMAAGMFGYMGPVSLDYVMLALQKKIGSATPNVSAVVPMPPAVDPAVDPAVEG